MFVLLAMCVFIILVKGAHLMPPGERFITWDLPVVILVGVAKLLAQEL